MDKIVHDKKKKKNTVIQNIFEFNELYNLKSRSILLNLVTYSMAEKDLYVTIHRQPNVEIEIAQLYIITWQ